MEDLEHPRRTRERDVIGQPLRRLRPAGLRLEVWLPLALVAIVLGLWEWASRTGRISPLFFPPPTHIAIKTWGLTRDGELPTDVWATFSRLGRGFIIGASAGLLVGLLMGWSRPLRATLDPIVAALHPVPKIALLPLFLIIFGIGEAAIIFVVAVAAFFPMLINSMTGVLEINPIHFEVADNFGARRSTVLRRVVLPGSLPMVIAGARLSLNTALIVTVASELVIGNEGLGAEIWFSWETLRTERLYASIVVISLIGILFNFGLRWLARQLTPWKPLGRGA